MLVEMVISSPSTITLQCQLNGRRLMANNTMIILMMRHGVQELAARNIFPGMHGFRELNILLRRRAWIRSQTMLVIFGKPELQITLILVLGKVEMDLFTGY